MSIFSSKKERELEEQLATAKRELKERKKEQLTFKKEANKKAQSEIERLNEVVIAADKKHKKELEELQDTKSKEVKKTNDENERLNTKIQALNEASEADLDIHRRTIVLEKKEAMYEAQEEALDTLKKQFKTIKDEAEEAKAAEYTKGYADGISDGIRKGIDASQEDRKHLAQVAMVAAASHTPQAAEIVAREFKNVLPATTSSKNK